MKTARLVSKGQAFLHQVQFVVQNGSGRWPSLASAPVGGGHIATNEERLVLLMPVVQLTFITEL